LRSASPRDEREGGKRNEQDDKRIERFVSVNSRSGKYHRPSLSSEYRRVGAVLKLFDGKYKQTLGNVTWMTHGGID
jgi:hypothetical protein